VATTCSGHGKCDDSSGAVKCTCDEGYKGAFCNRCDDKNDPCGEHGTCDDSLGIPLCECERGYTDVLCDKCAPGFHNDGGVCVIDETCLANTCDEHGECSVVLGEVACDCDDGYVGDFCDECDTGYHRDENLDCVVDEACAGNDPCAPNGTCTEVGGVAVCDCTEQGTTDDPQKPGIDCEGCLPGFQDANSDGTCALVCNAGGQLTCANGGICSHATGEAVCSCIDGWGGTHCETCAAGFHPDDVDCVSDQNCADNNTCGTGKCRAVGGIITCDCRDGYTNDPATPEADCSKCSQGYHDEDAGSDLVCVRDENCDNDPCGPTQDNSCAVSDGVVVCDCGTGYRGDFCEDCVDDNETDYHRDSGSDHRCVPDETCPADTDCGPASLGSCSVIDGIATCVCVNNHGDGQSDDPADDCAGCAEDYQDNDGNSECLPTCEALGGDAGVCNNHGTCSDDDGTAGCTCTPPWSGSDCMTCGTIWCQGTCCQENETVCHEDTLACCDPVTCDELDGTSDAFECGLMGDNQCGGQVDCGNCGDEGDCSSDNTCNCNNYWSVVEGEHECRYACDGILPTDGCCSDVPDEGQHSVFCQDGNIRGYKCPSGVCGWDETKSDITCGGTDTPPSEAVLDCLEYNIVYTPPGGCVDDALEDNDAGDSTSDATPVVHGDDFFATKCPSDDDFYWITLQNTDTLYVTLCFDDVDIQLDLIVYYPTWAGDLATNMVANSFSGGAEEQLTWEVPGTQPASAVYYIRVVDLYDTAGNYRFILNVNTAPGSCT
jgi:hypothetical protein